MRDFRDAKDMAQTLREALKAKSISLTHSESLELVAKVLGFHDWNVLSARIQSECQPTGRWDTPSALSQGIYVNKPVALPPISAGTRLPSVSLRDIVLFPNMSAPLFVVREASKHAVERAMAGDQRFLAVTQRHATDDNPAPQDLYRVGVTARVINRATLHDGTIRLVVESLERAAVVHLTEGQFPTAEVAPIEESGSEVAAASALMRLVLEKFQTYRNAGLSSPPYTRLPHIRKPGVLADAVAPFLLIDIAARQDLLETSDVMMRLEKILAIMEADRQTA